jgi:predicted dehydrogenase
MRLFIDSTGEKTGADVTTETFPLCDQYTLQGDAFSKAILEGRDVPVTLEMGIKNMAVIEAVFRSARQGEWVAVER